MDKPDNMDNIHIPASFFDGLLSTPTHQWLVSRLLNLPAGNDGLISADPHRHVWHMREGELVLRKVGDDWLVSIAQMASGEVHGD